jgi:hypothetical protein
MGCGGELVFTMSAEKNLQKINVERERKTMARTFESKPYSVKSHNWMRTAAAAPRRGFLLYKILSSVICAALAVHVATGAESYCIGSPKARQTVTNREVHRGEVRTTTFERPWQLAAETADGLAAEAVVTVDVSRVDQEIMGFGTAVSELSWKSLSLLSEGERGKALDEMFSPSGGNFTVVRTPIGASDFALDYYSYDHYPDIRFGVKLHTGNIGFSDGIWTFPLFCAFLLPDVLSQLPRQ